MSFWLYDIGNKVPYLRCFSFRGVGQHFWRGTTFSITFNLSHSSITADPWSVSETASTTCVSKGLGKWRVFTYSKKDELKFQNGPSTKTCFLLNIGIFMDSFPSHVSKFWIFCEVSYWLVVGSQHRDPYTIIVCTVIGLYIYIWVRSVIILWLPEPSRALVISHHCWYDMMWARG